MRPGRVLFLMPAVDPLDDLHMTRQHVAKGKGRPLLQRFRQQRVVGIAQTSLRRFQRHLKRHAMIIGQKPHQFRPRNRRMGVVHLDRHMFRQRPQISVRNQIPPHDILQRRRGQEKLLLQPQFLALIGGVIGVKHAAKGPCQSFRFRRRRIIPPVEPLKIKQRRRLRAPKPQRVGPFALPADHRRVMRRGQHRLARHPTLAPVAHLDRAFEPDRVLCLRPLKLPRMALGQPVFRRLDLPPAFKPLTEQAMLIADAIAIGRAAHR